MKNEAVIVVDLVVVLPNYLLFMVSQVGFCFD